MDRCDRRRVGPFRIQISLFDIHRQTNTWSVGGDSLCRSSYLIILLVSCPIPSDGGGRGSESGLRQGLDPCKAAINYWHQA